MATCSAGFCENEATHEGRAFYEGGGFDEGFGVFWLCPEHMQALVSVFEKYPNASWMDDIPYDERVISCVYIETWPEPIEGKNDNTP